MGWGWLDPFKIIDRGSSIISNAIGRQTASEKRAAQNMMNEQIKAYKDQTNLAREELNRKQGEMKSEKRRIEEKQIRHLRRSYRPSGFLNNQQNEVGNPETGVSAKLGG